MTGYADLHLHTTASDGTLSPTELVSFAKGAGLSVIAVTDHDTVIGAREARQLSDGEITVIPGIELSSLFNDGSCAFKLHILGLGIDPDAPAIREAVCEGQEVRRQKHSLRLDYLRERYGIEFTDEERSALSSENSVAKPHLASLLVKRGIARSISDAIRKYMSSPDFPDGCIPHTLAIESILASGGIPVYAHPLGGECEEHLSFREAGGRISLLREAGIRGVECYYSRYSSGEAAYLSLTALKLGLSISGGSDFHGENKTVGIGELIEGKRVMAERLTVLSLLT